MSLSIASNPDSVNAQTNLRKTTDQLSDTFERLSSGLRINKASDDPAGLIVADKLRTDAATMTVALRNSNDGLSLAYTADAALGEVQNILTRMSELANQSANSVYTTDQRSALELEFVALGSEVERIAKTTTFNGIKLLSASSDIVVQAGIDGSDNSQITIRGVLATLNSLALAGGSGALGYTLNGTTSDNAVTASRLAISALDAAQSTLSTQRGYVGAAESRLAKAVDYLGVVRDNFVAAESRIRDADIAEEVANMVRLQVLQQSGVAVLAQANQNPETVLKLLA